MWRPPRSYRMAMRRLVLRLALAAAAAFVPVAVMACGGDTDASPARGTEASAEREVSRKVLYRLDYFPNATDVGFYVAAERGFYRDEGLEVSVEAGQGSANTAQQVNAGQAEFGTIAATEVISAVSAGADLVAIGTFYQQDGAGILVNEEITSPEQLKGKTIVSTSGSYIENLFINAYRERAGLNDGDVRIVHVDSGAVLQTFLAGRAAGCTCLPYYDQVIAEHSGAEVNFLPFSDYEVSVIGQVIATSPDVIEEDPEMVAAFMRASLKGWQWAYDNPDEAAQILSESIRDVVEGDVDVEADADSIRAMKELRFTELTEGEPFGKMALGDWQRTLRLLQDADVITGEVPDPEELFTNEFVPGA